MSAADIRIAEITIGPRIRQQPGDLQELAGSIDDIGLLQPIVVTPSLALIAGERRLRACRDILGWETIPARVVDLDDLLVGERDENEVRKDFAWSERVALKRAIEARIGERQGARTDLRLPEKFPEVQPGTETRAYAAQQAGLGNEATARQAELVVDTAVPELVEVMDAGNVAPSQAAKIAQKPKKQQKKIAAKIAKGVKPTEAVRQVTRDEISENVVAIPDGKHRVIYADPPWSYNDARETGDHRETTAAGHHYPTMSLEQICALDVKSLADRDAVLFMWATFPLLPDALEVVAAWGFKYKTAFVWDKRRSNFGHYHDARGPQQGWVGYGRRVHDPEGRAVHRADESTGSHARGVRLGAREHRPAARPLGRGNPLVDAAHRSHPAAGVGRASHEWPA